MKTQNTYIVNVGNIGNIEYTNKKEAINTFNEYVKQSQDNYGRAAGESVYLIQGDGVLLEYIGTIDQQTEE